VLVKLGGNWAWRFTWDQINDHLAEAYKSLASMYERPAAKKGQDELDTEN